MASETSLLHLSDSLADAVAAAAPSVVQVHGRRRPASGIVYAEHLVVTTVRATGGEDRVRVRADGGDAMDGELAGWDPATGLAVVRVPGLAPPPLALSTRAARVGQLALAVARSWSNAVTASAGIVSVIGGPLPTGRHRAIDRVIRTSAPMHDGFSGGALLDAAGGLLGVATAAAIRGLGVVIPADIAWSAAARVIERGTARRGYLGVGGQPVVLRGAQRDAAGRDRALLVIEVTDSGPAAAAGVLVGDVIVDAGGRPIAAAEDLLDALLGAKIGSEMTLRVLRGSEVRELRARVAERPHR